MDDRVADEVVFEVVTPPGLRVSLTRIRSELISSAKHPITRGREDVARSALQELDEVRRSRSDPTVLLFYRSERPGRWVCVVVKAAASKGWVITAYPTGTIKVGDTLWNK